jgi:hypothetical protein
MCYQLPRPDRRWRPPWKPTGTGAKRYAMVTLSMFGTLKRYRVHIR